MQKVIEITNRSGVNLSVKLNVQKNRDKLIFLIHGLGSRKDYPHMQVMEDVFAAQGYNVINIDAADSNNQSGKSKDGITFTGHYNDLQDVINWAKTQDFYAQPFSLAGQSMGAVACALYAANNPSGVNMLVTANFSWLDGKIESKNNKRRQIIMQNGFYEQVSKSTGKSFIIKQNYLDDLEKYNLTKQVKNITANTALIVGMADSEYHIENNKKLYKLLKCPKQIILLDGVPHDLANTEQDKAKFKNALESIF